MKIELEKRKKKKDTFFTFPTNAGTKEAFSKTNMTPGFFLWFEGTNGIPGNSLKSSTLWILSPLTDISSAFSATTLLMSLFSTLGCLGLFKEQCFQNFSYPFCFQPW